MIDVFVIWFFSAIFLWLLPLIAVIKGSEDQENREAWIALTFFTGLLGALIYAAAARPKAQPTPRSSLTKDVISTTGTSSKEKEQTDMTIVAERPHERGVFHGSASLGRDAIWFECESFLFGDQSWRIGYKDIEHVEVEKDVQQKTRLILETRSQRIELLLRDEDSSEFIQKLKGRILELKPLGKAKSETVPLTREDLLRSAMKALDQGDKELAKRFMDQAESIRD